MSTTAKCSVEGCTNPVRYVKRGWCGMHYQRWTKHGDLAYEYVRPAKPEALCSVEGCQRTARTKGWCPAHYMRWQRWGSVDIIKQGVRGGGFVNKAGYRKFHINGKHYAAHRVVMERILGRPLKRSEAVHHIDGNKLNNTPENLEVLSNAEHVRLHRTTGFRSETHKECACCHQILPRSAFRRNYTPGPSSDPNGSYCVPCIRARDQEYRDRIKGRMR